MVFEMTNSCICATPKMLSTNALNLNASRMFLSFDNS